MQYHSIRRKEMGFSSTSNTETKYCLFVSSCNLLLCFCQLLSNPCTLRDLRQVGLFLLLLGDAPVELYLGFFSLEGIRHNLCLIAQPTITLHLVPNRPFWQTQNFAWQISGTLENCGDGNCVAHR